MNILHSFSELNWLSVIVSALAAFAVGGLWYSPFFFGKPWQKLIGLSDKEVQDSNMLLIFGSTFLLNVVGALVLDLFLGPDATLFSGLIAGLLISMAWVTTSLGINYLFSRKPFKLFLIDAGYFITFFILMGIILGAWK